MRWNKRTIKIVKKVGIFVLLFLLSAGSSTPAPAHDDISLPSVELTQSQKAWLKSGDIIFRKAEGLVSDAILSVDAGSDYSHAGLVRRVGELIWVSSQRRC